MSKNSHMLERFSLTLDAPTRIKMLERIGRRELNGEGRTALSFAQCFHKGRITVMAKKANPRTSLKVARKASRLLRSKRSSPTVKSVAAAALGGRRPKR